MNDLKYKRWIDDGIIFPAINPQNQRLLSIAKAFEQNRNRVLRLGELPFHLVSVSIAKTHVHAAVMEESRQGKLTSANFDERIDKLTDEAMKGPASVENASKAIEMIVKLPTRQAEIGMEALLSSIVILAFGAFENLAIDLWIEAVNSRPRKLAMTVLGSTNAKPKGDEGQKSSQEKMISFSTLADYDFNISGKMGNVLRDRKVVTFESFDGIKMAYEAVFLEDGKKSKCPELGRILGNHVFPMCQLIRNLFAHKSGVVDQKFHERIHQYDEVLGAVAPGNPLPLDFQEVRAYVNTLFTSCSELVDYVDKWLSRNQE